MRSIKLFKLLDLVGIIPSLNLIDQEINNISFNSKEGIIPTKSKSLCNFIDLI